MIKLFKTLDDILDYAAQREEDSAIMYFELADRMKNPEVAQLFRDLAKEEIEHKQKIQFESLKSGKTVDFNEQIEIMLPEIEENPDALIDISYPEALVMAIKKEELAFHLYTDLAHKVRNNELKQAFLQLAEEEVKHKFRFEIEYEKYSK